MIPRLIASAPRLTTKICRPTAAKAITCPKRAAGAASASAQSVHRTGCSCVGSSTLASSSVAYSRVARDPSSPSSPSRVPCSSPSSSFPRPRSRRRQQRRANSISSSVAASYLGNHGYLSGNSAESQHHYGSNDGSDGSGSSNVGVLDILKKMKEGTTTPAAGAGAAGRRGGRSGRARHRGTATLASHRARDHHRRGGGDDAATALDGLVPSVRDLLAQLAQQQQRQKSEEQVGSVNPPNIDQSQQRGVRFQTPTLEVARSMPLSCRQMDNTSLMCLAALDVVEARSEVLRRHIMDIDSVSYEEACQTYQNIRDYNHAGLLLHAVPYKFGIAAATAAAFVSIPLCFHLPTVEYFNDHFVTSPDVPDPDHLKTWLEVGAWSWDWMEPPLGQLSFMILCLQCARNQLGTIGHRTYGGVVKRWRATRLVEAFPRYDAQILDAYSRSVPLISGNYK